uniref:Methenyltetrahydrofolate synthase domain-containing protein n=1 Tax=Callorhinchus milii TaxID=7868 RepID=A0A4W3JCF0_CALMI
MEPAIKLKPGITKWDIRQKVWDYMEANDLANFPRPVHHRIPNFKGAGDACSKIVDLDFFSATREVKVDPDKPLEGIRLVSLQAKKTLLVPTPRLRTGLFNKIIPPVGASKEMLRVCSTARGVKEYSVPVGLDAKVHVDLIVVGSVAVSDKGWRIGKGEGFSDLEYSMMVSMGAVDEKTVVVTTVHDSQVLDVPGELMEEHDLTVDYILTPTRVIRTNCRRPKPKGVIWSKMMGKIPILKHLRFKEKQAGKDVRLMEGTIPAKGQIRSKTFRNSNSRAGKESEAEKGFGVSSSITTVYIGNIPHNLRVSELKDVLREHDAVPVRLNWKGAQHRAFLDYRDEVTAGKAVTSLSGLRISGIAVRVELAKSQRETRLRDQATKKPTVLPSAQPGP